MSYSQLGPTNRTIDRTNSGGDGVEEPNWSPREEEERVLIYIQSPTKSMPEEPKNHQQHNHHPERDFVIRWIRKSITNHVLQQSLLVGGYDGLCREMGHTWCNIDGTKKAHMYTHTHIKLGHLWSWNVIKLLSDLIELLSHLLIYRFLFPFGEK